MALRARKINKKVLLLKPETTFNVDSGPDAVNDAMYCEAPMFSPDVTVLTRANIRPNFSKEKNAIGRKLGKIEFTIESRSNGKQTGLIADESQLATALRCCGMNAVFSTTNFAYGPSVVDEHVNPVTWASTSNTYAGTGVVNLVLTVVTGGASGTATIAVSSDDPTLIPDKAAAVVTTNTAFTVATGITFTPTFAGALAAGQSWSLMILPPKHARLTPSSDVDNVPSATLYLYQDGTLHVMTGAFGTAVLDGAVNGYGKWKFTFIGQYYDQVDAPLPANPVFERTKPAQIELAKVRVDGFAATISKFSVDLGVTVLPRLDANGSDGYNGTYIDDRNATGGIDPETTLVADQNFWQKMSKGKAMPLTYRMGTTPGNIVYLRMGASQYTGLTYQARDNLQTYDAAMMFAAVDQGDDEVIIVIA